MKVVLATSEAIPFIKTGGLADVSGTLLDELRASGVDACLILPLYRGIKSRFKLRDTGCSIKVTLGSKSYSSRVLSSDDSAYFIECDEFFNRQEVYGTSSGEYPDNAERYIFFSKAVMEACIALDLEPDVMHANDWQTALIPLYMKTLYKSSYKGRASLFTIHNLGYQGIFPASAMKLTGLGDEWFTSAGIEFFDQVNLLKAGIVAADAITTVSENYSREIMTKEYGAGLEGVLKERGGDIAGILNGLDYDAWDPSTDSSIPAKYSASSFSGKQKCKRKLAEECEFKNMRAPLAGFVGRLSSQKGVDLLLEAVDEIISCGLNAVVLGSGEKELQKDLQAAAKRHAGRFFVKTGFDDELARRIYAGSDMLLMPSHYEPCGLVQMIAMRYGTVPVARATGGLVDSIKDYDHLRGRGTGFLFSGRWPSALAECVKRAICVYRDKKQWKRLAMSCMKQRFSWKTSARKYVALYRKLIKQVSG
jgi:starch synthase